ncbi:cell division protein SepF [Cellulomonas citrea]|uniref:cell division protein SepF n=1 Tax=Cellulomonas citrea TaxID=1909423 RepID=UPI00135CA9A9|nr:cell division protein SepF [Cellulomonas citrea]
MAGALRKTMLYLGLADGRPEDEEYLDLEQEPTMEDADALVTPLRRPVRVAEPVVEAPLGEVRRITTIHPRSYNDARKIGEAFRDGTPVIINLTDMDDADAKRLVDFSAGLIFGLHGAIERVTAKVFLLSPSDVEVTSSAAATPEPAPRGGFFNQS